MKYTEEEKEKVLQDAIRIQSKNEQLSYEHENPEEAAGKIKKVFHRERIREEKNEDKRIQLGYRRNYLKDNISVINILFFLLLIAAGIFVLIQFDAFEFVREWL